MAGKEFTAPRDGICYVCGQPYVKGDPISWPRTGPNAGKGCYQHPTCQDASSVVPVGRDATILDDLAKVLGERLGPQPGIIDETAVRAIVAEAVRDSARVVRIERPTVPPVTLTQAHRQAAALAYWLGRGKHVHLYGAPGAGKSHVVRQVAEALGRTFYVESLAPTDTRSILIGYKSATTGEYFAPPFRQAVEHGGVVALEEADNTASALLVTLNVLLANGTATFPDGPVKVHPDFVCVILTNTNGRGGDVLYPERRPIDTAFLNRFIPIAWEYDTDLERGLALERNPDAGPWVSYCQALRTWALANRKRLVVSYRQTLTLAETLADPHCPLSAAEVVTAVLFGNADGDLRREADAAVPVPA
jgi:dynein-related subfamily AAA family protein